MDEIEVIIGLMLVLAMVAINIISPTPLTLVTGIIALANLAMAVYG